MAFILPEEFKRLDSREQARLINDAIRPLTPAERETKSANVTKALDHATLREIAAEIATARVRFCSDAIASLVKKGDVPQWIGQEGKGEESREWLRRNGYFFEVYRFDPLRMRMYKGDRMVAEMVIQ